jgi:hypothetical protein
MVVPVVAGVAGIPAGRAELCVAATLARTVAIAEPTVLMVV